MRIVHITPSLAGGGAERMLSKICEADDSNEHIVISLLNMQAHYKIENAEVIELNMNNNLINKVSIIIKLYKVVSNLEPDIVQTWMKANFYGIILSYFNKFKKVKFISNFRNGYNGTNNKVMCKVYNRIFDRFDGHIFVSKSAVNERMRAGLRFNNYRVITNGFNIPPIINEIDYHTLTIGHMGRYHKVKNQQMLIDAFNEFSEDKNTKLLLAGRGLNNENLDFKNISESKIFTLDEIKEVNQFYEKLDVFVLTSISEGFPNVVGEAMSHGVPVITTDAGESWNIIGGTGYKITDKKSLTDILKKIYSDRSSLKEKSVTARNRINEIYSLEKIIIDYQDFYKEIGGKK